MTDMYSGSGLFLMGWIRVPSSGKIVVPLAWVFHTDKYRTACSSHIDQRVRDSNIERLRKATLKIRAK